MNEVSYKKLVYNEDDILKLYLDNEWTNYTNKKGYLFNGIKKSLYSLACYDENILVGLIRVVGDENTIIYIQDILVLRNYQNQGIGSELLSRMTSKYNHVRQIVLSTDNTLSQKAFYEKNGFKNYNESGLVAFIFKK